MAVTVRPARPSDLDDLAKRGAELAKLHHSLDSKRFMLPDDVEGGYRWWFERELANAGAAILVADLNDQVIGYAYGRMEERNWNSLLDAHGGFHDLWVDPEHRGAAVGTLLAQAMMTRLVAMGAPRVVLATAATNAPAQKLFARLGWRPTMLEMTREA